MNPLMFQVYVEKATPACSADCPNLDIEIETTNLMADRREDLCRFRRIHCANDEHCQRLYGAFNEELKEREKR